MGSTPDLWLAMRSLMSERSRGFAIVFILVAVPLLIAAITHVVRDDAALDLRIYRDAVLATFRDGRPLYGTPHEAEGLPFTYPPFAVVFLAPLAAIPLGIGAAALVLASLALAITVYLLIDANIPLGEKVRAQVGTLIAATLVTDPFRLIVGLGQIDALLALLVLVDAFVFPPPIRGLGMGIAMAVKLTPVVFLAYLAWQKQWRSIAVAVAAAAVCCALAEVLLPHSNVDYAQWLLTHAESIGRFDFVSNQSVRGLVARVPGLAAHTSWWWAGGCVIALGLAAIALWKLSPRDFVDQLLAFAVVSVTGLLVAPIAWSHHWTVVMIVCVFALVSPDMRVRTASWILWAVALCGLFWFAGGPPVGFIHGWLPSFLVSNCLVLAAVGWLLMCALGTNHQHGSTGFPSSNRQHQASEHRGQHHGTGPPR